MEIFFLFFLISGVLMYILDLVWLRVRNQISMTSYLLSGCMVGILFGLLTKAAYPHFGLNWILVPVITMSGSFLLYIFAKFDFYKFSIFQLFGTIILGVTTGLIALFIFICFHILYLLKY